MTQAGLRPLVRQANKASGETQEYPVLRVSWDSPACRGNLDCPESTEQRAREATFCSPLPENPGIRGDRDFWESRERGARQAGPACQEGTAALAVTDSRENEAKTGSQASPGAPDPPALPGVTDSQGRLGPLVRLAHLEEQAGLV